MVPHESRGRRGLRVVLIDEHGLVRYGLHALLATSPNIEVVGEAGTTREAIATVERLRPNLVLMDMRLAGKTVRNYVSSVLSKLGVRRRGEAAAYLARVQSRNGSSGACA